MTQYKDVEQFKIALESTPSLCLVIAEGHREIVKKFLPQDTVCFDAENFNLSAFLQEIETLPFLKSRHFVALFSVDQCVTAAMNALVTYAKAPSSSITLFLSTETLASNTKLFKEIEKNGIILNLAAEKPWEREKLLIKTLCCLAEEQNVVFSPECAKKLILKLGKDESILQNELFKLICFVGDKKQITLADIDHLSLPTPQETIWQLGDAILNSDFKTAYQIGMGLLNSGTSFFALLGSLKTQSRTQLEMFLLHREGGNEAVAAAYPYLKGGLLQKKIDLVLRAGNKRLEQAYVSLLNSEIDAKNTNLDPTLIFELLLIKLCPSHSYQTS